MRKNLARNLSPAKFEISKMDAEMGAKMAAGKSIEVRNFRKTRNFLGLYWPSMGPKGPCFYNRAKKPLVEGSNALVKVSEVPKLEVVSAKS